MSERLPLLAPDVLEPEQRRLYDAITAGPRADGPFRIVHDDGTLAGPFNALLYVPQIGDAVQALGAALRFGGSLTDRTRELVICAVAAVLDCEYEWYAHSRVAAGVGVSEAELAQLQAGGIPAEASDAEQAALELARDLVAEAGASADHRRRAVQHFGDDGVIELAILVGYYRTLAGLLAVAAVPAPLAPTMPVPRPPTPTPTASNHHVSREIP